MNTVIFTLVLVAFLGYFARTIYRRFMVLTKVAAGDEVESRCRSAFKAVLVYAFGQKKFVIGEQPAGWMHFFIFWGFTILAMQVIPHVRPRLRPRLPSALDVARSARRALPPLEGHHGGGGAGRDRSGLYRWGVSHPARLYGYAPAEDRLRGHSHWEAYPHPGLHRHHHDHRPALRWRPAGLHGRAPGR